MNYVILLFSNSVQFNLEEKKVFLLKHKQKNNM